ncbi:MAG: hypothetical protein LBK05_07185 [Treponema sp.]|nr:hypothetical protein [Treponema sp.]
MGRKRNPVRAGLLAVFAAALALFPAHPAGIGAQTGGGGSNSGGGGNSSLGVSIRAEPVLGAAGSIWTVTILADHPAPAEVRVRPPDLPPSLRLERVRISPQASGGARRTVVEYDFLVLREAPFTLGPFELSAPGKRGLTQPFTVRAAGLREPGGDLPLPRLFWAFPPPSSPAVSGGQPGPLRIGKAAEIALCYEYPPNASLPAEARSQNAAAWSYRPGLPVNAILEILPGPPQTGSPAAPGRGESGVLLRFRLIPLEGRTLSLPETRLTLAGRALAVPALDLIISPAQD